MFTPTRTALCIAIGAMALAANEANAGCKTISGTKVCAAWITGSEICNVKVTGIPTPLFDGGEGADVSCTVDQFDAGGLIGTVFCGPLSPPTGAKCRGRGDDEEEEDEEDDDGAPVPKVACEAFPTTSLPTTSFPFSNDVSVKNFIKKNGSVKASIELDPTVDTGGLCTDPNFPTFMTFNADKLTGTTEFFIPTGPLEGDFIDITLTQKCTLNSKGTKYNCTVVGD